MHFLLHLMLDERLHENLRGRHLRHDRLEHTP